MKTDPFAQLHAYIIANYIKKMSMQQLFTDSNITLSAPFPHTQRSPIDRHSALERVERLTSELSAAQADVRSEVVNLRKNLDNQSDLRMVAQQERDSINERLSAEKTRADSNARTVCLQSGKIADLERQLKNWQNPDWRAFNDPQAHAMQQRLSASADRNKRADHEIRRLNGIIVSLTAELQKERWRPQVDQSDTRRIDKLESLVKSRPGCDNAVALRTGLHVGFYVTTEDPEHEITNTGANYASIRAAIDSIAVAPKAA